MRYIHSGQASRVLVAQFAGDALVSLGNSQARFKIHISAPTKSSCDSRSASKGVNNKPMNLNGVRCQTPSQSSALLAQLSAATAEWGLETLR